MTKLELVIFDMAGTTVRDNCEVETCFARAAAETNLLVTDEEIKAVQGWSKRRVFSHFWIRQLGKDNAETQFNAERSYIHFKNILEHHYRNSAILPTDGALALFAYLRERKIKIALTTGFYREVTNIILAKLGWNQGLNESYVNSGFTGVINCSVAGDEVGFGRPQPDMIHLAMQKLQVTNPLSVINIGDTPSDLESGKLANLGGAYGVTNGTHSRQLLNQHDNDELFESLIDFHTHIHQLIDIPAYAATVTTP